MPFYCGFDFGTSNTVVTLTNGVSGGTKVFADASVLFLPDCGPRAQQRFVGKEAVEQYLASGMNGRFIQSIKSALSDPGFTSTVIYGKSYIPEELVAMILRHFKGLVDDFVGVEIERAVFGRPARFADSPAEDVLAETRVRSAAERCGFKEVLFQYEPVAAAERYTGALAPGGWGLVCDLGGGTADFTVLRCEREGSAQPAATHGVRVGGDDFDSQIMWHRLVGYFGFETDYESYGRMLPVPVHFFRTICRWDRIPFLKTTKYAEELRYIRSGAGDKEAISRLITLIEKDLGFALFQAIREAKHSLSDSDSAAVRFFEHGIEFKERIYSTEFESFIAEETARLSAAIDRVLEAAGVSDELVSTVFLTGGSSVVRPVRKLVDRRFPLAEIHQDSDRFNTVSLGLAVEAHRRGLSIVP